MRLPMGWRNARPTFSSHQSSREASSLPQVARMIVGASLLAIALASLLDARASN